MKLSITNCSQKKISLCVWVGLRNTFVKTVAMKAISTKRKGLMGQTIESVVCDDCQTIQPLVTGGVIGDAAPSFRTIVGRICLNCGSMSISQWNGHSCPKCQGEMEYTGEKEYWR